MATGDALLSEVSACTGVLTDGGGGAAGVTTTSWWLAGSIAAATVLGAYQAAGAASLAASYSNLANPGTNDLTVGVAPAWDTNSGWTFDGATTYLITAFDADDVAAVLVRYSVAAARVAVLYGARTDATRTFEIYPWYTDGQTWYTYGGQTGYNPYLATGCLGVADGTGYRDGAADGAIAAGFGRPALAVYVGAMNFAGGIAYPLAGSIQAIALYGTAPTAAQMLSVAQAMSRLGGPAQGGLSDVYVCRGIQSEQVDA